MKTIVKVPWPQPQDSAFAAFPWNIHIINTYEAIFKSLKNTYKNLEFNFGYRILPSDEKSSGILEFIDRNRYMYQIFVERIEKCHIFIADITDLNPNVMLELGIAMKLNKNVLILRKKEELKNKLPFNIQSVHINDYSSVEELEKIIFEFIEMYSKIVNQTLKNHYPERYKRIDYIKLEGTQFINLPVNLPEIRNLIIKFNYNFLNHGNTSDWVGIHLRTQGDVIESDLRGNSELIYTRVNGSLEKLTWPSYKLPSKADSIQPSGENFIEITLMEDKIEAKSNSKILKPHRAFANEFGKIIIGSQSHSDKDDKKLIVECTNIESLNLDTTSP